MRLVRALPVLMAMLLVAGLAAADYATGLAAYERGAFAEAAAAWQPLAEAGDAAAQLGLSLLLEQGLGVSQDQDRAFDLLQRSALQGHADAEVRLGMKFAFGEGGTSDPVLAEQWLTIAADRGNPRLQAALASMFATGFGVRESMPAALEWYRRAANQGHKAAQRRLAQLLADAGDDLVEAYFWASLAEFGLQPGSFALRRSIEEQMTPAQLAEARERAHDWRPTTR